MDPVPVVFEALAFHVFALVAIAVGARLESEEASARGHAKMEHYVEVGFGFGVFGDGIVAVVVAVVVVVAATGWVGEKELGNEVAYGLISDSNGIWIGVDVDGRLLGETEFGGKTFGDKEGGVNSAFSEPLMGRDKKLGFCF